jgi:Tfp pilus assembly protein PilX
MLKTRLIDARGSALVPALLIMGVMLTSGLALLALTEGNQRDSRREREREATFQLAEGVLNAQIYRLSTQWPSADSTDGLYPAVGCTATSVEQGCPNGTSVQANFSGPDYTRGVGWKVQVRDNSSAAANHYTEAIMGAGTGSTLPRDFNGDNFVWARAEATVAGHKRVLVALVEAENTTLNFPRAAVVAGKFATTNKGNKVIIDTNGGANNYTAGDVIVRCDPATACAMYERGKGQIEPDTVKGVVNQPNAVSPEALETLRQRAIAEGNYIADGDPCPGSLQGDQPGEIVFIENSNGCSYQGNAVWNTKEKPGFLVIGKGTIYLLGTTNFYGVIYHANTDNSSNTLVDLNGNTQVIGAIAIDGAGGLMAGSSKENVVYDPNVILGLTAFGTASIVQNTFREIRGTN